jgi:hypothetical protein
MAVRINIATDFVGTGLEKAKKEFQQLEGAGAKAAFLIKKAAIPAAAALAGLAAAGKKFIDAGEKSATANAALENVTRSMGLFGNDTAQVTDRLLKYAEATARATGIDNLSIKATQTKLMTFAELGKTAGTVGGAFDRATQAAIDLAAAGFGSAESNAVQLGKALQDPIKGVTALAKSGVTFTAQEKEKIKALVESNKMLEAQEIVLEAIEKQVGGTALATANDTDKMREAFAQAGQSIGRALLPFLQKLTPLLAKVADFAAQNRKVIVVLGFAVAGLATSILALNAAMKVYKATQMVVTGVVWAFNAALNANPISLIVIGIAALIAGLVLAYKRFEGFRDVVDAVFSVVRNIVETVIGFVVTTIDTAITTITGVWETLGPILEIPFKVIKLYVETQFKLIRAVITTTVDVIKGIWSVVTGIFTNPIGTITKLWSDAGAAIGKVFTGIGTIIEKSMDAVVKTIKGAINIIINGWNKIEFKIPGFKIGPVGYSGFTLGLPPITPLATGGIVTGPMLSLIGEAGPEAVIPLEKMNSMGFGGGETNVTINVSGGDPQAVVDALRRYMYQNGTVPIRVSG